MPNSLVDSGSDTQHVKPEVYEAVEHWHFVFVGGVSWGVTVRTEAGEQMVLADRTYALKLAPPAKSTDGILIERRNLLYVNCSSARQRVYGPGESPVDQEVARLKAAEQKQKAAIAARRAVIEDLYAKEA